MSYWNTTRLKGDELKKAQQKSRTQDEIIKDIINGYKGVFSTKDVYKDIL